MVDLAAIGWLVVDGCVGAGCAVDWDDWVCVASETILVPSHFGTIKGASAGLDRAPVLGLGRSVVDACTGRDPFGIIKGGSDTIKGGSDLDRADVAGLGRSVVDACIGTGSAADS